MAEDLFRKIFSGYLRNMPEESILACYQSAADLGACDEYGRSLLHIAAQFADIEAVAFLLERGIRPNQTDSQGGTALHALCEFREWKKDPIRLKAVAEALLKGKVSPQRKDENGYCAYHRAAERGMAPFLEAAAEAGVRMNAPLSRTGENALHLACIALRDLQRLRSLGNPEAEKREEQYAQSVRILLESGLDPEEKDNTGYPPLHYAVEYGSKKIAALLKGEEEDGAAALRLAAGGMTLHQAAAKGDAEAVGALVDLGEDLEEPGGGAPYAGMTPLMAASWYVQPEAVKKLLEKGASPRARSEEEKTALAYLCIALRDSRHPLSSRTGQDFIRICRELLRAGAGTDDFVDGQSHTALNLLCSTLDIPLWITGKDTVQSLLAEVLLEEGCDVNLADANGRAPLHYVCASGGETAEAMALLLLENGADTAPRDRAGNTPLHFAAGIYQPALSKALIQLLYDFGDADADVVNNEGKTALDIAAELGHESVVSLLLDKTG